jgi:hypothetical protein
MAEWAGNIALDEYSCPRCGANPNEPCRTPKKKQLFTIHGERLKQLTKADWERCRGPVVLSIPTSLPKQP